MEKRIEAARGELMGRNGSGARDGGGKTADEDRAALASGAPAGRDYRRARELLWTAAHDLSAPLAAVRMHVRAKTRQHRREAIGGDEWLLLVERIDTLVAAAQTMIDDVLAIERLTEHPPAPSAPFPVVDAERVLADVIAMQAAALERAGCSVFVRRRDDLGPVRGRWNQCSLERLFSNLIQNVVRHAPGAPIEVSFARRAELLQIRFADGGPGLPPDKQRLGEEAFSKETFGETGGPDDGHGLGLWIVYRIVAEMGGAITMQSRAGMGLAFDIRLPFGV